MAQFSYKAVTSQGKAVDGVVTAERIELASRDLRSQGMTLLRLEPSTGGGGTTAAATGKSVAGRNDVLAMTRELAVLLRAGLPIDRALKVMIDMAAQEGMRGLLEELLTAVKSGKGLSQALSSYPREFDNFYISMVRSGEASGHLAQVLSQLAEYLASAKAVRSRVVSALIYPAILLLVTSGSIVLMLGYVVPQFESLFNDMGDALPVLTRSVIAAGDWIQRYVWLLLVVAVVAGILMRNWYRSERGRARFDERVLAMPLLGAVVYKYEVAKFARTVGTLLGNGVSLLQSIAIAVDTVENRTLKTALGMLEPAVKRGQRVSVALEEAGIFSPLMIQMARVGEESGSLDKMMTELSLVYDEEVEAGVRRSLDMLEPILILTMAGVIATIIISILMGIMSVNNLAL